MIPPHELKKKDFTKVVRGYASVEVDEHLDFVIEKYTELYRRNDELEKQLSAALTELDKYHRDEATIRNAVVSAQRTGARIIDEANARADLLVRSSKTNCDKVIADFRQQLDVERDRLAALRGVVNEFKSRIYEQYSAHIEFLEQLSPDDILSGLELTDEDYTRVVIAAVKDDISAFVNQYAANRDIAAAGEQMYSQEQEREQEQGQEQEHRYAAPQPQPQPPQPPQPPAVNPDEEPINPDEAPTRMFTAVNPAAIPADEEDEAYEDGEEYEDSEAYEDGEEYEDSEAYEDGEQYEDGDANEDGEVYEGDDAYEDDGPYTEDGQYTDEAYDDQYAADEQYADEQYADEQYADDADGTDGEQFADEEADADAAEDEGGMPVSAEVHDDDLEQERSHLADVLRQGVKPAQKGDIESMLANMDKTLGGTKKKTDGSVKAQLDAISSDDEKEFEAMMRSFGKSSAKPAANTGVNAGANRPAQTSAANTPPAANKPAFPFRPGTKQASAKPAPANDSFDDDFNAFLNAANKKKKK